MGLLLSDTLYLNTLQMCIDFPSITRLLKNKLVIGYTTGL